MSGPSLPADPFGSTTDPDALVARAATNRVLEGVQVSLLVGKRSVAVTGPAGIGKTLILHTLAQRLDRAFETVYLPYGALPGRDLCAWILTLRDQSIERDPLRQLPALARSYAGDGKPLLILVDDASSLPEETVRVLTRLVREADGALRVLLAPTDDFRSGRLLASFGNGLEEHRIDEPMTLEETQQYILGRLAWAAAPKETQERFDEAITVALHEASGGIPSTLNALAAKVLRGDRSLLERVAERPGAGRELRAAPVVDFDEVDPELETDPYEPPQPAQQVLAVDTDAPLDPPTEPSTLFADVRQRAHDHDPEAAPTIPDLPADDEADTFEEAYDEPWDDYDRVERGFKPPRLGTLTGTVGAAALVIALLFVAVPALRHKLVGSGAAVVSEEIGEDEVTFPSRDDTIGQRGTPLDETVEQAVPSRSESFIADRGDPAPTDGQAETQAAAVYSGSLIPVNINADPWAHVEVDGIYVGLTPLADVRLTPGAHQIRARLPNGQIVERNVEVDSANRHIAIAP